MVHLACGKCFPSLDHHRGCQAEHGQLKFLVRRRCAISTGGEQGDSRGIFIDSRKEPARGLNRIGAVTLIDKPELLPGLDLGGISVEDGRGSTDARAAEQSSAIWAYSIFGRTSRLARLPQAP